MIGQHTYQLAGNTNASVLVTDSQGGSSTAGDRVSILPFLFVPALPAGPATHNFTWGTFAVACLDYAGPKSDLTATINWGDKTQTTSNDVSVGTTKDVNGFRRAPVGRTAFMEHTSGRAPERRRSR